MKYRLVVITILASIAFYNPFGVVSLALQKLMLFVSIIAVTIYSFSDGKSIKDSQLPIGAIVVLLSGILVAAFMATAFHMQSLTTSIMVVLPFLFSYWLVVPLIKLDVPPTKIIDTYIILSFVSGFVYFANAITFPNNIFGAPILGEDMSRGILRLPIVLIEVFPLLLFYTINKWLVTKDRKWIFLTVYLATMIILSVIRQLILISAVLALFLLLRNVSWKVKILSSLAVVAVLVLVLPMIPMYQTMMELSEQQKDDNEETEDIRITSWRFYTTEGQTNKITPFLGNGLPSYGGSRWGNMRESEAQESGCYAEDVGWAGFYWYFGAFATLALIVLLYRAFRVKKSIEYQYLNYWILYIAITTIASGPILYFWQIVTISVVLSVIFRINTEPMLIEDNEEKEEESSFLLPRYPQLRKPFKF